MEGVVIADDPDVLDGLQMRYLRGYLAGAFSFLVLWFARFFYRAGALGAIVVGAVSYLAALYVMCRSS